MTTWIIEGRSDFSDQVVAQVEAKTLVGAFRIFERDIFELADYTQLTIMKVTHKVGKGGKNESVFTV